MQLYLFLFFCYLNGLPNSNIAKSILFADDRVLLQIDNNLETLQNSVTSEMANNWTEIKLPINISQTKYMLIVNKHVNTDYFETNVKGHLIERALSSGTLV